MLSPNHWTCREFPCFLKRSCTVATSPFEQSAIVLDDFCYNLCFSLPFTSTTSPSTSYFSISAFTSKNKDICLYNHNTIFTSVLVCLGCYNKISWLDNITDSMDMNLGKLRGSEGQGGLAAIHGAAKSWTRPRVSPFTFP